MSTTTQTLSKDEWKALHKALSYAHGQAELEINGHTIHFEVRQTGDLEYCIMPFINGSFRFNAFDEPGLKELVHRKTTRSLVKPAQVARMTKDLGKRHAKKFLDEHFNGNKFETSTPIWSKPAPLVAQLKKHAKTARLISPDAEQVQRLANPQNFVSLCNEVGA